MEAIGAIAGTILITILLWVIFMVWRWRRRKRPVALIPRESPHEGSVRGLLTPASEPSASVHHHHTTPEMSITPQNLMHLLAPAPDAGLHEGALVPSYDEATGINSPLNTPDPFRSAFGAIQIPVNVYSQPTQAYNGVPQSPIV